jgi:hypothetical protein
MPVVCRQRNEAPQLAPKIPTSRIARIVLGNPTLLHPTEAQGSVPTRHNLATCARRHPALGRGGDAHVLGGGGAGRIAAEVQLASM